MPPKPGIHPRPDAFLHAMAASIPGMQSAGLKWVAGFPENTARGLPYVSGLLILNDVETGLPLAVMDATWITAYRTGAATALAARYLARPDSSVAGILACGVQGRTNLAALATLFPLRKVYAYDRRRESQDLYVREMSERLGLEVVGVDEPRQAVAAADLVVTSGPILKEPTPTIERDWLREGAFGSAVDYDSYWSGPALAQMDRIATDDHAQFRYVKGTGYFQETPDPYADLGELVTGRKPGRQSPSERTLAMNLGLALDDMAVAPEVLRRAKEMDLGTWLPLLGWSPATCDTREPSSPSCSSPPLRCRLARRTRASPRPCRRSTRWWPKARSSRRWASLEKFQVPQWYQDAKFGIFIHWGVYSVPAFGNEWYPRNMYRPEDTEFEHHVATYGPQSKFGYKDFIPQFKAEKFDARAWARLFKEAGASYVVPVAEHHDGFPMYDCSAHRLVRRRRWDRSAT